MSGKEYFEIGNDDCLCVDMKSGHAEICRMGFGGYEKGMPIRLKGRGVISIGGIMLYHVNGKVVRVIGDGRDVFYLYCKNRTRATENGMTAVYDFKNGGCRLFIEHCGERTEAITINNILKKANELYDIDVSGAEQAETHEGGRNIVYKADGRILRVSRLSDRDLDDYMAETEYVHYLASKGASVADVILSKNGAPVEVVNDGEKDVVISLFETAKGDQIAAHGYRYRDNAPIEEYWYNTGKVLGKMHSLSVNYVPKHRRFDFFDRYNEEYFDSLIPDELICDLISNEPIGAAIKNKLHELLDKLRGLPTDKTGYGMVHFDYSDGNYNIDYSNGNITVFDFDNCRTCWYLFDLANLWAHGVGWIAWNADASERRDFMDRYFKSVLEGYRSEMPIDKMLDRLPLMVDAVRMENIIDEFEVRLSEDGRIGCDGEQAYRIKGLLNDIPFMGFFDEMYDCENPFDLDRE